MPAETVSSLTIDLDDIDLLTETVQVRVDLRSTKHGFFGPCTVELLGLEAEAFDLVLRDALDALEQRVLVRIAEVFDRRSPLGLPEDRATALPLALKLWAAQQRGRLRAELESAIEVDPASQFEASRESASVPDWELSG